jgi:lipopolysaccharide biosynthesis glycosyltransferase
MVPQDDEKIIVQSLIGRSQLPFYLRCLKSLLAFCKDPIDLQLHSDDSLSQEDKDSIHAELDATIITITESSQNTSRVLDCLQGRPNCQKFRKESIWGIEFFDPLFANPNAPISYYLDADILFLRPFSGLFDYSQTEEGAVFLKDTQWDAYCFRPWSLLGLGKKPEVVKGITTGLVFWDKRAIDWDYLEWFLGASYLHKIPEWIMPTAQAGLANRCNAKTVCPNQITNLYPNAQICENTFGVHLLGSYRKDWIEKLAQEGNHPNQNDRITTTRFEDCRTQDIFGYSWKQMKRWTNTRLNLW